MRKLLIGALMFGFSMLSHSQPSIQWQRTYGGSSQESGRQIVPLQDGGYFVAGSTGSVDGDAVGCVGISSNFWALRLDAQGELLWQSCYGGSATETCSHMTPTSDGGFVMVGTTNSSDGDISQAFGGVDIWVVKVNGDCDLLWETSLGGSMTDQSRGVVESSDGTLYVFGHTASPELEGYHPPAGFDYYLAKVSPVGELISYRCYGGSDNDAAYSVSFSADAQIIMTGATNSTDGDVDIGGDSQRWILAVDEDLNIQWQRTVLGPTGGLAHTLLSIGGELLIVGVNSANSGEVVQLWGEQDMFALKLGSDLQLISSTAFGGSEDESVWNLIPTPIGGLLSIGNTSSQDGQITAPRGMNDAWAVNLADDLSLRWMQNFGGSEDDGFFGGCYTSDGGLILTGYSASSDGDLSTNQGGWDLWVVKLGPEGVSVPEQPGSFTLTIAPNPANELLRITWSSATVASLTVYDATGQVVHSQNLSAAPGQLSLPVEIWAPGLYTISLQDAAGRKSERFMKE